MKHDRISTDDATAVSPATKVLRAMEGAVDRKQRQAVHDGVQLNRAARRALALPTFIIGSDYAKRQDTIVKKKTGGYAIDGLVPRAASTVWFGESAIGKTMIALWKALCIAARGPNRPERWCGQRILRRGIVIFYSGEDALLEGRERLRDIASMLLGLSGEELDDTVSRVFFVNPSDLDDDDFSGEDGSLFEKSEGRWHAGGNAEGIRASIARINEEATRPDERVAGVIQDSATSVSGFDAMEGEAVSRYFFWVNRTCKQHDCFWLVLGHISQEAKLDVNAPESRARYRLRGVVVWITAPRLVVEVRVPSTGKSKDSSWHECLEAFERQIASKPDDLLTVTVVKANVKDVCKRKIWMRWSDSTILANVSEGMMGVARSKVQYLEMRKRDKIEAAASGHAEAPQDYAELSQVVLAIIKHLNAAGRASSADAVDKERKVWAKNDEFVKDHAVLSKSASDGGFMANAGAPASVAAMIATLLSTKEIVKEGRNYVSADSVEAEIEQPEDEQEQDHSDVLGAILAIAKSMAANEPGVPIVGKSIEDRARATRWVQSHEALTSFVAKSSKGGEWALDQLVQSGHIVREVAGHYTVIGVEPVIVDADQAEVVIDTPAPDLEPVFAAMLAAVGAMEASNEKADEADQIAIIARNVLTKVLSTGFRKDHATIDEALDDGRLVRTTTVSKKAIANSAEWYLYEMTKPARAKLVRLADGAYALPSAAANDTDERIVA